MDNEIPSCGTVAFMALFVIFVVIIDLWSQKKTHKSYSSTSKESLHRYKKLIIKTHLTLVDVWNPLHSRWVLALDLTSIC